MIKADIKIDTRDFLRALERFSENSKRTKKEILRQQAKLFIRDVVKITPPNKNFGYNKPGGEAAIRNDLGKLFFSSPRGITDPGSAHRQHRNSQGRVGGRIENKIAVKGLAAYRKKIFAKVGILASGWNAAARRLGLVLPAWISRHGTRRGRVVIKTDATGMSIEVVNSVRFAGDVKGIDRRIASALRNRARQMDKQMDAFAVKRAAREAGLT